MIIRESEKLSPLVINEQVGTGSSHTIVQPNRKVPYGLKGNYSSFEPFQVREYAEWFEMRIITLSSNGTLSSGTEKTFARVGLEPLLS